MKITQHGAGLILFWSSLLTFLGTIAFSVFFLCFIHAFPWDHGTHVLVCFFLLMQGAVCGVVISLVIGFASVVFYRKAIFLIVVELVFLALWLVYWVNIFKVGGAD